MPDRTPMTEAQRILAATYDDGEFSHLAEMEDSESFVEAAKGAGDTLFSFLAIELSANETSDDLAEAPAHLAMAMRNIEDVLDAVNARLALVP